VERLVGAPPFNHGFNGAPQNLNIEPERIVLDIIKIILCV
jgi:hypothetical protein